MVAELELVVRGTVALIFFWAGLSKARQFSAFKRTLDLVGFSRFSRVLAVGVIAAELAVSMLLALDAVPPFGFVGALALSFAFGVVGATAARLGIGVPCNCFGNKSELLGQQTVVRAILLSGLCVGGLAASGTSLPTPSPEAAISVLTLVPGLLLLGGWVLTGSRCLRLVKQRRNGGREAVASEFASQSVA